MRSNWKNVFGFRFIPVKTTLNRLILQLLLKILLLIWSTARAVSSSSSSSSSTWILSLPHMLKRPSGRQKRLIRHPYQRFNEIHYPLIIILITTITEYSFSSLRSRSIALIFRCYTCLYIFHNYMKIIVKKKKITLCSFLVSIYIQIL